MRSPPKFCQLHTKKAWSNFHTVRISPELKRLWASNFEQVVQKPLDPIFIQHVTQQVMEGLLKIRYPVSQAKASSSSTYLAREEENALRYAAGYIPFALRQKLQRSRHPLKEDFIICLNEFCDKEIECTDNSTYSAQWVKQVNRGGLKEVNDMYGSRVRHSAAGPQCSRSSSVVLPQYFRSRYAVLPQYFRSHSAVAPPSLRSASAVAPQSFRSGADVLPQ